MALIDRLAYSRYVEVMFTQPTLDRTRVILARVAAIFEVLTAFCLVHLSYRSFKHFTNLGQFEVSAGLNFSPGIH